MVILDLLSKKRPFYQELILKVQVTSTISTTRLWYTALSFYYFLKIVELSKKPELSVL